MSFKLLPTQTDSTNTHTFCLKVSLFQVQVHFYTCSVLVWFIRTALTLLFPARSRFSTACASALCCYSLLPFSLERHKYLLGRRRWRLVSVKWLSVSPLQIRGSAEAVIGAHRYWHWYKCPFTGKNEAWRSVTWQSISTRQLHVLMNSSILLWPIKPPRAFGSRLASAPSFLHSP